MKKSKKYTLKNDIIIGLKFLCLTFKLDKFYIPLLLCHSFLQTILIVFNMIIFRYVINALIIPSETSFLELYVLLLVLVNFIINLLIKLFGYLCKNHYDLYITALEKFLGNHIMNMMYDSLEDAHILDMKETALHTVYNQKAIPTLLNGIVSMVTAFASIITMLYLLTEFNFIILIIIILLSLCSEVYFNNFLKQDIEIAKNTIPLNRNFVYFYKTTMDFSLAKDIRMFQMLPLFQKKLMDHQKKFNTLYDPFCLKKGKFKTLIHINFGIQTLCGYIYAVYKVINRQIDLGQFTVLISAITKLSDGIFQIITNYSSVRQACHFLELFMEFQELPENLKDDEADVMMDFASLCLEFRNVYFSYPGQSEYALENVSFQLKEGDKLSIVGENGAGKTTIAKLICRLYIPTKGIILLNGFDINKYSYEEYIKNISAVFQDFKLFAFSIKQNVTLYEENIDENRLTEIIKGVGLWEQLNKYKKGIDSKLYKIFDKDGINLSGGQLQKLAIARAVFKNAGIMILDEPTAALDPIAEAEIYANFEELTKAQLTIYISHRLSSCRFCNKIIVLRNGRLVEFGTHDELIKLTDGVYNRMWHIQKKYYV